MERRMAGSALSFGRNTSDSVGAVRAPGELHAVGEAEDREDAEGHISHVEFPPSQAMTGRSRKGVMVVVPALSEGQERHPPEIG